MVKKIIQGWNSLSDKQQELYKMVLRGDENLTLDAMREELGVKSINTVVHHLKQLEQKGYIRRYGDYGRIEALPAPVRDIVYLNLYGMARCGREGFFNEENVVDTIPFPIRQLRVNPDSFLIEARGDSMEPMIHDRDLVLVDKMPVDTGDIAVIVYDGGAVLKKIYKERGRVILQSLNSKHEPIITTPAEINTIGVVRGVVRDFRDADLSIKQKRP